MSLWKRIARWLKSHPLMAMFNQPAFNKFAALHPWVAHFGTAFFGLILALGTFTAIFVAIPIHLSSRHLVQHGVEISAIINDISTHSYKSGRANKQMYETTVRYHFTARDGWRYDGTSKLDTPQRVGVDKGAHITVLYDASNPQDNEWRMAALINARSDFFVWLGSASLLFLGWFGLYIYRYLRWRRSCAE
jgi:hypothetical protein